MLFINNHWNWFSDTWIDFAESVQKSSWSPGRGDLGQSYFQHAAAGVHTYAISYHHFSDLAPYFPSIPGLLADKDAPADADIYCILSAWWFDHDVRTLPSDLYTEDQLIKEKQKFISPIEASWLDADFANGKLERWIAPTFAASIGGWWCIRCMGCTSCWSCMGCCRS